jgi:hypothetical protein
VGVCLEIEGERWKDSGLPRRSRWKRVYQRGFHSLGCSYQKGFCVERILYPQNFFAHSLAPLRLKKKSKMFHAKTAKDKRVRSAAKINSKKITGLPIKFRDFFRRALNVL